MVLTASGIVQDQTSPSAEIVWRLGKTSGPRAAVDEDEVEGPPVGGIIDVLGETLPVSTETISTRGSVLRWRIFPAHSSECSILSQASNSE